MLKHLVKLHRNQANRVDKIAGVGIIDSDSNVTFIFNKDENNGDNIVVKQCETASALNVYKDCKITQDTFEMKISVFQLKKNLKSLLVLPGKYTDQIKREIYERNKYVSWCKQDLIEQELNIKKLNNKLQELKQKVVISDNTALITSIKDAQERFDDRKKAFTDYLVKSDIDQKIDKLVESMSTSVNFTILNKNDSDSIQFNVLYSFIKHSDLLTKFVKISGTDHLESFEIQQTELTQAQWFDIMGDNPSNFKNKNDCHDGYIPLGYASLCAENPVENVSLNQIKTFIRKLNEENNDGYVYSLPTEAQWQHALHGQQNMEQPNTTFFFGNDVKDLDAYAWYYKNSGNKTHIVKSKNPNNFGLYDMYGNVSEFLQPNDQNEDCTYTVNGTVKCNIVPNTNNSQIKIIGGSFNITEVLRDKLFGQLTEYINTSQVDASIYVGFRLVRTLKK